MKKELIKPAIILVKIGLGVYSIIAIFNVLSIVFDADNAAIHLIMAFMSGLVLYFLFQGYTYTKMLLEDIEDNKSFDLQRLANWAVVLIFLWITAGLLLFIFYLTLQSNHTKGDEKNDDI